jgi:hypothetical protein
MTSDDRGGWTEGALAAPWPEFELCYECNGSQLCPKDPCPYCKGWCHVCGGAGQWPLDPDKPYFTPAPPLINLHYVAQQRAKQAADE